MIQIDPGQTRFLHFFTSCRFNRNILPSASNSVLSYALSIVLEVGIKLSHFDNKDISEFVRFRLGKFTAFLLTKLPCNLLSNILAASCFRLDFLSIEPVFTSRILTKIPFLRSFTSLRHVPIHLNLKDNASCQSQEGIKLAQKFKKPILKTEKLVMTLKTFQTCKI